MKHYLTVKAEVKRMLKRSDYSYNSMRDNIKRKDIERDKARQFKRAQLEAI